MFSFSTSFKLVAANSLSSASNCRVLTSDRSFSINSIMEN